MLNSRKLITLIITFIVVLTITSCNSSSVPDVTEEPENNKTDEAIEDEITEEPLIAISDSSKYEGKWKSLQNHEYYLVINGDNTGEYYNGDNSMFTFTIEESGLKTDLENGAELLEYELHGIRHLSNENLGTFYLEDDLPGMDQSEEVQITADNWQDYFEIHKDTFGESSYETGRLCYLCEIFYVTVKEDYAERLNVYKDFSVSFDFSFHHLEYYANVDDIAHTFEESEVRNDYKTETGSCVFNNESYSRIKDLNYTWGDGFAHANLRDDYIFEYWYKYKRDIWYYDTVKEIELDSVSGSIYLFN